MFAADVIRPGDIGLLKMLYPRAGTGTVFSRSIVAQDCFIYPFKSHLGMDNQHTLTQQQGTPLLAPA